MNETGWKCCLSQLGVFGDVTLGRIFVLINFRVSSFDTRVSACQIFTVSVLILK